MLRTQAYDVVHKRFGFITEFLSMGADEMKKAAQNLQQCYPNDLELSFPQELKHFSCFIERLNSDKEMPTCRFTCTAINLYNIILNHCLQSTFPNVEIAYQMYLSLISGNQCIRREIVLQAKAYQKMRREHACIKTDL